MEPPKVADPLGEWRDTATIRPVFPDLPAHSLHAYFGVSPESPDGRTIVAFVSDQPDGHRGRLVLADRNTRETRIVDKEVEVEDPHRQANQQWVSGGDYVVYMTLRGTEWAVIRVDTSDLSASVLCTGRQLGWGHPHRDEVPLYGPHWNPAGHRDVEMLNVRTGELRTVLTVESVLAHHRSFVNKRFGPQAAARGISLFFPTLSPDGRRLFLKLAVVNNGQFRSPGGSERDGLLVYELAGGRPLAMRPNWAHPCWYPDSRRILQKDTIFDVDTTADQPVPNLPSLPGAHAMPSPESRLMATDSVKVSEDGRRGRWRVLLADLSDGRCETLHVAPEYGDGTKSWRKTHPHPSFNALGNRIYFNVNLGAWSSLHVAERD